MRNATSDIQKATRGINIAEVRARNRPKMPEGMKYGITTAAVAAAALQRSIFLQFPDSVACIGSHRHPFLRARHNMNPVIRRKIPVAGVLARRNSPKGSFESPPLDAAAPRKT